MQVTALRTAPRTLPQPGDVVVRGINDDAPGDQRDVRALTFISGNRLYATVPDAVFAARQYQRMVPSKQWGDQAIAIFRDDAKHGYTLLQLDSVLAGFEGRGPDAKWWSADAFQTHRPEIEAVVNGFYQVLEARGPVPVT
ncbi:MAG: hypothetical protein JWN72_2669 [Thermoleophilia bacterium]|nr:hypothetical protein [Thermoleophilia bacterium]